MNVFVTSDTHFGHAKILEFKKEDGQAVRPFASLEEMHEEMVERWNKKVGTKDIVYHLGDVATESNALKQLDRLNGNKILIKGNRDLFSLKDYSWYFYEIHGAFYQDNFILSHIPVNEISLKGFKGNIHGHLHCHNIEGGKYFNACVENHDYAPVEWEKIEAYFAQSNGRASDVQHAHSGAVESRHSQFAACH